MRDLTKPTTPLAHYLEEVNKETAIRVRTATPITSEFAGADADLIAALGEQVAELTPTMLELSHDLHANPEVAFEEHHAAQQVAALCEANGVPATIGAHGLDTAVHAEFGSGRAIAICAEYDALPGIGHACGHNVIAACGVGAFLALKRLWDAEQFPGRVVLLGTPAEEGHTGKEYMARAGALEGIDAAIMVHGYNYDLADQVWLGRRTLRVTYRGRTAHASAEPFMGRNALDAASLLYQGLGLLRQQMIPVDRVHAVIIEGGHRASVIPETAVLDMYVRSKYPETLKDLSQRVEDVARGAALMSGVGIELNWDPDPPSLPVRTNQALTGRWATHQRARGREALPKNTVPETIAASTDFGNVSFRVPGIHPLLRITETDAALHTRDFAAAAGSESADAAIPDGIFGLAATALDYLADDALAQAVRAEFDAAGGPVDVPQYFNN